MKGLHYFVVIVTAFLVGCSPQPKDAVQVSDRPDIFPDYADVTVPVNIAPLNFKMKGEWEGVYAVAQGESIEITSSDNEYVSFDVEDWGDLLQKNAGDSIRISVFAEKQDGSWVEYAPFPVYIKESSIDPYLAYRLIAPGYQVWSKMGIYQRSLNDFEQSGIITNRLYPGACVNCHSFQERDAERMMFHLRGKNGGTFFKNDTGLVKVNSKPDQLFSGFQYPYWHPGGRFVAFSINKTAQAFHALPEKRIEVFDSRSDLVIYDTEANKVITEPRLMSENWFETFPAFSPDGKYLYYCSSAAVEMPSNYQEVKYNLCRIGFDAEKGTFTNKVDTLVRVADTNQSVTFPRISPDGNHLLFTLADYGNFSIWHKEADLYMLDMESGEYQALENANSSDTESYHSWSSNSDWIVFSSRRVNGLYTMPYIAHIAEDGSSGKPFLLPQENPDYYMNTFYSFNIPEFVDGKVDLTVGQIDKAYKMAGIKVN